MNDHGCNQCLVVADGDWIDTVVDGRNVYGIIFLSTQDLTDDTFSVSEFIWLLRNSQLPTISVDTAHRHNDPNAKYPNFNFATSGVDLSQYGVIWLIAYEGNNDGFNNGNPITPDEVAAITKFMDTGAAYSRPAIILEWVPTSPDKFRASVPCGSSLASRTPASSVISSEERPTPDSDIDVYVLSDWDGPPYSLGGADVVAMN